MRSKETILKALNVKFLKSQESLDELYAKKKELRLRYEEANTGDLSENSAYWNVKDLLSKNEVDIKNVNDYIDSYIDFSKITSSINTYACLGCFIEFTPVLATQDIIALKDELKYIIVPKELADQSIGALSITAPAASAALGKMKGDEVVVKGHRIYTYLIENIM